jgi:hypothetical protein
MEMLPTAGRTPYGKHASSCCDQRNVISNSHASCNLWLMSLTESLDHLSSPSLLSPGAPGSQAPPNVPNAVHDIVQNKNLPFLVPQHLVKSWGLGNESTTVIAEQQGEDQTFLQSKSCYVVHRDGPKLINSKTMWVGQDGHGSL